MNRPRLRVTEVMENGAELQFHLLIKCHLQQTLTVRDVAERHRVNEPEQLFDLVIRDETHHQQVVQRTENWSKMGFVSS